MNNKRVRTKAMAMAVAAAMAVELCPVTAFAVTGDQVAADGTYTSTAQVNRDPAADVDDDWADYGVSVELTVKDGRFENITVTPDAAYSSGNDSYFNKAYNKSKGIKPLLEGQPATEATINGWKIGADGVSGATRTATAVKQAALAAIQSAAEKQDPTPVEVKTDGLQASITAAEEKNQADYTEASWTNMTEKLTAAKVALEAKESQEAVDAAQTALDAAVAALKPKPSESEKPDVTTGTYVLMNIPYDQFYAADVNNSVKVDAFTSATKNKVRTAGLAGGSYHVNASGDEITGVTFPVKLGEGVDLSKYTKITDDSTVDITVTNRGQTSTTTYTGKDALFESASYSYYVLSEAPSYYKEVTLNADGSLSFGKTQGGVQKVSGVKPELTTETKYGDYQLNLDGLEATIPQSGVTVYGVIVSTSEENDYGMRHLENIWRVTELAWSTGFTSVVHNCPTSSEHYKSMMGQHINKVTYYTSKGIYEIPVDDLYVPKKAGQTVSVENGSLSAGETEFTFSNLPADFVPEYKIDGLDFKVENGKIVFTNAKKGKYTLTVSDKNNAYADMTTTFILSVDSTPAAYNNDNENPTITKNADASDEDFADYINSITSVSVNGKSYAASGRGATKLINTDGTLITEAAAFTDDTSFDIVVTSTGYPELKFTYAPEYKYVYAGLTWAEYWAQEGVQAAGDSSSSSELDNKNEYDKGAFDTVTRATTNHGLHRGSFQCNATIYMKDGKSYDVAYYTGVTTAVLTDGTTLNYNKNDIDHYVVTGLKYVPVKVKSEDYEAFCQNCAVVKNGEKLSGGHSESSLKNYTNLTAAVTKDTNGLKTVTKNGDSFSFSARTNGTASGISGAELKDAKAEGVEPEVREAGGSYGEFLRVDINGNYGGLGASMQAVKWTYYGDDSTYTTPVATFGTKFAADNWMHKSMGIQLGLTESERCELPEGSNGTGYWRLTVYALGYEDYTYDFQATEENSVLADPVKDRNQLDEAIKKAEELKESDYTADSWKTFSSALKTATGGLYTQKQVNNAVTKLNKAMDELVESATYVLMNIPYDEFYKADVNNDVKVDAFTSATKNKVRTGSLAGGSYHVDASGDEITGVTFPVKVPAGTDLSKYTQITDDSKVSITVTNKGQESTTDYTGKDALFESASYSYYTLSEKPSYYKELTVNEDGIFSFGATQGTATAITEGVTAELLTESRYGDYQLKLAGLTDTIPSGTAIYGVIVSTKEGSDYGMRHLENIWKVSKLAWATGFTSAVHNCPTSSEHYKAMMGQHINKVIYYTANGIYEIPVGGDEGLYVPVKFDTSAVAVADAELKDGETSVATTISGLTLPEGFDAEYTVDGATAIVKGEKLILKDVKKGAYTLKITDKSGKYAPISVGFEVYAETIPASYNENTEKPGLTKAAGATDTEFADYIKNITSVSVNGKSYAASGRGAVKLFNDDGTLITDAAPFAEGDSFEIVVTATGYKDLSFTYKKASSDAPTQEVNTSSLEKAIQSAETLKEADYTADSWKVLQVALKNAKSALEAKKDQTSVDNAAASLNKAMEALVKADGSAATPTPTTTPTTTPAASKNNTTTSGTGNKTTTSSGSTSTSKTAKTGDPTNIFEMLGLAVASLGAGGFALKRRKRNKK